MLDTIGTLHTIRRHAFHLDCIGNAFNAEHSNSTRCPMCRAEQPLEWRSFSSRELPEAERFYVKAGMPQEAVEMYTQANKLEAAHALAVSCMDEAEVGALYIDQAHRMAANGKFKDAEKLFLTVNEHDRAINMYKKARKYDHMIRLVKKHRPDMIVETHLHLAQQLETVRKSHSRRRLPLVRRCLAEDAAVAWPSLRAVRARKRPVGGQLSVEPQDCGGH